MSGVYSLHISFRTLVHFISGHEIWSIYALVTSLETLALFFYCCTHILHRITDVDVQDYDDCTALHYAARNHHNNVAIRLLEDKGADMTLPDGIGDTPVHMAAESGNHEYVSHKC